MSQTIIVAVVSALGGLIVGFLLGHQRVRRSLRERLGQLNNDILNVAEQATFGQRLDAASAPEAPDLVKTVNQLLDTVTDHSAAIGEREQLFRRFAMANPEVVLIHDQRIYLANESAANLIGLDPDKLVGRPVTDLVKPAYRAIFRKTTQSVLDEEVDDAPRELQLIDGAEQGKWVEARSQLIQWEGKAVVLSVARDISYRRNLEASLGRGRQFAQFTLESIAEGVVTTDTSGRIDYMNRAAESLTGYPRGDVSGRLFGDVLRLVDESDRRSLEDPVERCLATRQRVSMGRRAVLLGRSAADEHSVELTASPIRHDTGNMGGVVILVHDVSELRGLTRQMSYQASHDALTGLINRREFERRLKEALSTARSKQQGHVLAYIDLDRFKAVNDSCGHQAGDRLLQEIAAILKDNVRDSDFCARIGGDEFALLLVGCPLDKARQIATTIVSAVADYRFVWQNRLFTIGASVGLVEIGADGGTSEEIMAAADSACYIAKQRGRGRVEVYTAREESIARERGEIVWLKAIQTALANDGFELYTQSILSLSGADHGPAIEVLLRLPDSDGAASGPRDFMVSAERYQLMPEIDRWVVRSALTAVATHQIKIPENRSLSINLSGQTLGDASFLEFVVDCLDTSGVAPNRICFEVTETALIANLTTAQRFIEVLHGMGAEFALDDFGSGLGAFSKLKHLPVDYLKIDGSFTRGLAVDAVNQEMVTAMVKLAETLRFRTVAEEVEDQSDFDAVRAMGVDFVQGYVIEKPLPLA
ncbi:MAG: EAL domain-containing protein [Pseudomonadota bacterium]